MNKIFRLKNKANSHYWIIAENESEPLDIAMAGKLAKEVKNLKFVLPKSGTWYDFFKLRGNNMSNVDTTKGIGCVAVDGCKQTSTWLVCEIFRDGN